MRLLAACLLAILLASLQPVPALAVDGEEAAVRRVLSEHPLRAELFAPAFLNEIPLAQVEAIAGDLRSSLGELVDVRLSEGEGSARFAGGDVPLRVGLDGSGRIAALWFGPPRLEGASPADLLERLRDAASGEIAVLLTRDGEELVSENGRRPMAVASAFKLVVLRAYEEAVAAGEVSREQVTRLEEGDRSLPSGVLQSLPAGTPVTLETLAGLMIRISDNTATDALMRVLGRERLEALSPRNRPFLDTREVFQLAASEPDVRARFREGDERTRREMLAELAQAPLPDVARIGGTLTWPDAEWFLTAEELCGFLWETRGAPVFDAAPAPWLAALAWPRVAYKGGSERGVLNLSAAGGTADGRRVCAVVTANGDDHQPDNRIAPLFAELLRSAARDATPHPAGFPR